MTVDEIINNYIPEKIKKCPCCNGTAKINYYEIVPGMGIAKIWIGCTNPYCKIQTRPIVINDNDAINVRAAEISDMIRGWNRRVKKGGL